MLSLVIVHDETRVNDAGYPAQEREQQTEDETQDAASHQHGHRRQSDAKEIAERFHCASFHQLRAEGKSTIALGPDRGVGFLQRAARVTFAGLAQFLLRMDASGGLVGSGLRRGRSFSSATSKSEATQHNDSEKKMSFHYL